MSALGILESTQRTDLREENSTITNDVWTSLRIILLTTRRSISTRSVYEMMMMSVITDLISDLKSILRRDLNGVTLRLLVRSQFHWLLLFAKRLKIWWQRCKVTLWFVRTFSTKKVSLYVNMSHVMHTRNHQIQTSDNEIVTNHQDRTFEKKSLNKRYIVYFKLLPWSVKSTFEDCRPSFIK